MSDVIDTKVVEMQFDNTDFEKNANESISTLNLLSTALDFTDPAENAKKSFSKIKDALSNIDFKKLGNDVADCGSNFLNFTRTSIDIYAIGAGVRALNSLESQVISLTKSMTVEPISQGWAKYGEKTTAVQTIIAATGKSIDEVNESLDKLVWFSDETSYSLSDMTRYLGSFTSAGVDMETGIKAMMGISTAAALAGKGTSEAGRAMYNFAQALAIGSVKIQDWKSIEYAGMATTDFKQSVMDAAVEVGTLTKAGDKYYTTTKHSSVTTENFSSTLNEAWFSSEVLTKSLAKYGGYAEKLYDYMNEIGDPTLSASEAMERMGYETEDLGYKSFKAAQEALTFAHAITSIKDAVSSGWASAFESIFGNFEQARVLWTDVANELYEIFASPVNEMNDLFADAFGLDHYGKLVSRVEEAGASEEQFHKAAVNALKRHGYTAKMLNGEYKSLEEYVSQSNQWATPEIIADTMDELTKFYTVSEAGPQQAAENWKNLQNEIKAAGGDVGDFIGKALEVSGAAGKIDLSDSAAVDSWALENLTSSVISGTFSALAEAGTESNEVVQKNSVSLEQMNKVVDDILNGSLGVGQERIDKLTKMGYDAAAVQALVNKRAKGGVIEFSDLDKTLLGVTASSEELINYYKKQSKIFGETEGNLKELSAEALSTGSEMYRLSQFFTTKSGREFVAEGMIEILQQLKAMIDSVAEAWTDIFPSISALQLTEIIEKIRDFIFSLRLSEEAAEDFKNTFKGLFSIFRLGKQIFGALLQLLSPILSNVVKIRDGIFKITGSLGNALNGLTATVGKFFENLKKTSVLDSFSNTAAEIGKAMIKAAKYIESLFYYTDLGNVKLFEDLEAWIDNLWNRIGELRYQFLLVWNGEALEGVENEFMKFSGILQGVKHVLSAVIRAIKDVVTWLSGSLSKAALWLSAKITNLNWSITNILKTITNGRWIRNFGRLLATVRKFLNGLDTGAFLSSISRTATRLKETLQTIKSFIRDIGYTFLEVVEDVGNVIKQKGREIQASAIKQMAIGIGLIAGACWLLAQIPAERLIPAAIAIAGMTTYLIMAYKNLASIKTSSFKVPNFLPLIGLSLAVVILARAVNVIGQLDLGDAIKGVAGTWAVLKMLTAMLVSLERQKRTFISGGFTAILMSAAVRILVGAVKQLGELSFAAMMKGVTAVGLVLAALSGAYALLSANKSKFQTGGIVLVLMAASVKILAGVVETFSSMETDAMWRAVLGVIAVLAALSGAYVLLSLNRNKFQTGGIVLVLMAASVKILADVAQSLAQVNTAELIKSCTALTYLFALLVGGYFLLSLNKSKIQTGGITLILLAASVKILGDVVTNLAKFHWTNLAASVTVLTVILGELIGVMAILSGMKSVCAQAIPGIGVMFLTVLALKPLLTSITDLARMQPERIFAALAVIAAGLVFTAAAMVAVSFLPAALGPVALGIAAFFALVVEVGALIAAMGGLYQIPGAKWLVGEGKAFLQEIGEAIGGFFGGIWGSIAGAVMNAVGSTLPALADNLVLFIEHLQPFLDGVKGIDKSSLDNITTLNKVMAEIVAISSADWIYKKFNNGKSSFISFGNQLVYLGKAIGRFTKGVLGINAGAKNAVELDENRIKVVKECLDTIHEMLAWQLEFPQKQFKVFCENLRKFAKGLKVLGPAVAAFFSGMLLVNAAGEPAINQDQLDLIKQTVPIVTDLANTEFKATSEEFGAFGSKMETFSELLPDLGSAVGDFVLNAAKIDISGAETISITQGDVDLVKSAVPIITDLASLDFGDVTDSALLDGRTKLEKFATDLPAFGTALNSFISNVVGLQIKTDETNGKPIDTSAMLTQADIDKVTSAVGLVSQLAAINFSGDPNNFATLGEQMTDFGVGLTGLGEPLGTFISGLGSSGFTDSESGTTVPPVNANSIRLVTDAINAVSPLTAIEISGSIDNFGNLKTNLTTFGEGLEDFGPALKTFISGLTSSGFTAADGETDDIPAVSYEKIALVKNAIAAIQPLAEIEIPNTRGLLGRLIGGEGDLTTLADGLDKLGEPLYNFITSVTKSTGYINRNGTDIDVSYGTIALATKAIDIIKAIAEIELPDISGLKGTLIGGNGLDLLVRNDTLGNVGKQLSAFLASFNGIGGSDAQGNAIDPTKAGGLIDTAKAAVAIIDALAQIDIPTEQNGLFKFFSGDASLENFTENFETIGKSLNQFIMSVAGLERSVDEDGRVITRIGIDRSLVSQVVEPAVGIMKTLAEIEPELQVYYDLYTGQNLGTQLSLFAEELVPLGESLNGFITAVNGVGSSGGSLDASVVENAKTAADIAAVFGKASADIQVGKNADFKKLGKKLTEFAPYIKSFLTDISEVFSDEKNPIKAEQIENVLSIVPLITSLLDSTVESTVSTVSENGGEGNSILKSLGEDIKTFVTELNGISFENDNLDIISGFVDSMQLADPTPFAGFVSTVISDSGILKTSLCGLPAELTTLGINIVEGLIIGLGNADEKIRLQTSAQEIATIIRDTIAGALGIQSPSRVMRDFVGKNIGAGLEEGLAASESGVANASDNLAETVSEGIQNELEGAKIAEKTADSLDVASDMEEVDRKLASIFSTTKELKKAGSAVEDSLGSIGSTISSDLENADLGAVVKKAVTKSDLATAVDEGLAETNVDEVAGFADQSINALSSRKEDLADTASSLAQTVIDAFRYQYAEFETIGTTWGERLAQGLTTCTGLSEVPAQMSETMLGNFVEALNSLDTKKLAKGEFDSVSTFVNGLYGIYDLLQNEESDVSSELDALMHSLFDGLNNIEIPKDELSLISSFANEMVNAANGISGANKNVFSDFVKDIANAIKENSDDITAAAQELVDAMLSVFVARREEFVTVGKDTVTAIADGLKANIGMIRSAASQLASGIKEAFETTVLGENGPAQSGRKFIEGLVGGLKSDEAKRQITEAIDTLFNPEDGRESGSALSQPRPRSDYQQSSESTEQKGNFSVGSQYAQQFVSDFSKTILQSVDQIVQTIQSSFTLLNEGVDLTDFASNARDSLISANEELADPIAELSAAFHSIVPDGRAMGEQMLEGLIAAFDPESEVMQRAMEAAAEAAALISGAFKSQLKIFSPSRVFRWYGEMSLKGYVIGIQDGTKSAVDSVTGTADRIIGALDTALSNYEPKTAALSTVSNAMQKLCADIYDYVDTSPVISPILDLSRFDAGAKKMETALGRQKRIAAEIAAKHTVSSGGDPSDNNAANVTYVQNINSPKALRSAEIYRATSNMLARAANKVIEAKKRRN